MTWCRHCDAEPRAYADGLGRACRAYRRKYGTLPSSSVLVQRERRKDERRYA